MNKYYNFKLESDKIQNKEKVKFIVIGTKSDI